MVFFYLGRWAILVFSFYVHLCLTEKHIIGEKNPTPGKFLTSNQNWEKNEWSSENIFLQNFQESLFERTELESSKRSSGTLSSLSSSELYSHRRGLLVGGLGSSDSFGFVGEFLCDFDVEGMGPRGTDGIGSGISGLSSAAIVFDPVW